MAILVVAGSLMHLVAGSSLVPASFGPWLAIAGGAAAVIAAFAPSSARVPSPG
jgi:hypothetical protein